MAYSGGGASDRPRDVPVIRQFREQEADEAAVRGGGFGHAANVAQQIGDALAQGFARRDTALGPLQISAGGLLAIGEGEEVIRLRELARPNIALYVGGMGARGRNFYNDLARRYGYEKEAAEIQDLYLAVWQELSSFRWDRGGSLSGWMFAIARNMVADRHRGKRV